MYSDINYCQFCGKQPGREQTLTRSDRGNVYNETVCGCDTCVEAQQKTEYENHQNYIKQSLEIRRENVRSWLESIGYDDEVAATAAQGWDGFDTSNGLQLHQIHTIRAWITNKPIEKRSYLISMFGPNGTGKTLFSAILAAQLYTTKFKLHHVLYIPREREHWDELNRTRSKDRDRHYNMINMVRQCPLLIVDEFGNIGKFKGADVTTLTAASIEWWRATIDIRRSKKLMTILISNLNHVGENSLEKVENILTGNHAIASRLYDGRICEFAGGDFRKLRRERERANQQTTLV